ncbi:MAG TPA: carboxypeptidase regulatory-like domain-containing protein [Terriglobales bacterium]
MFLGPQAWRLPRLAITSLVLVCLSDLTIACPPAMAQSAQSTLSGAVTDKTGAAIVGAEVQLWSGEQLSASTSTDRTGHYQLRADRGSYTLSVHQPGFDIYHRTIALSSSNRQVSVALAIATVSESVSVQGQSLAVSTDPTDNKNVTDLKSSDLDHLPILDNDYVAFMSQFMDSGMLGTAGASIVVNGVEANGPGVTASAIQSVKINNNPYSALFSRPGRARLEITTTGGTPQYHGKINFSFRDSTFDATPAFASSKPSEQRKYFEGSLTGPIRNSKHTTFLASAQRDLNDDVAIVDAVTPTGSAHENVTQPTKHLFASGRVFHDYGESNQFWIGYSYERRVEQNEFVGGLVLPEAGAHELFQEHEISMQHTRVISSKWLNQLRVIVGHYDDPVIDDNEGPKVRVLGAFTGGSAQGSSKRTEYHLDGNDVVTYSSGKHELKFGVDVPDISRRGADDFTEQVGTYTFASLADYLANRPSTLQINRGNGRLVFFEANVAGMIEDTIRLRPDFTLTLGTRYYFQNFFGNDPNNVAPRLGYAWKPKGLKNTVVRGGAGMFYDRTGPRAIADLLHFNGQRLQRYILEDPSFSAVPDVSGLPISLVELGHNAHIPYIMQYSGGVEQQIGKGIILNAEYVGASSAGNFRSLDKNAPLAPFASRPDPALGQVRVLDPHGHLSSNALEISFRGNIGKWFTGQAQYRLSKTLSDTDGITAFPANSYAPELDASPASWDQRHRFWIISSINLPHQFTLGTGFQVSSGTPYTITTGRDDNGDGIFNDRPFGVSRNSVRAAAAVNLDAKLTREFKLRKEGRSIVASVSALNLFNHTNPEDYVGVITSPFFGQPTSAAPPRRIQFNAAFKF